MSFSRSAKLLLFFGAANLKSASSHKDGGCPAQDPCNDHCFFDVSSLKSANVTRMVGVLITTHAAVVAFLMLQVSKVPTVTRVAGIRITTHATVIVFDSADIRNANCNRDGVCPPPPAPQGAGKKAQN